MQDHLTGKQYLGWKAIRDEQTRLQEQLANQRLPPPPSRPSEDHQITTAAGMHQTESQRMAGGQAVIVIETDPHPGTVHAV